MKALIIGLFIIITSIPLYAANIFPDASIKELQILSVHPDDGRAVIKDTNGGKSEIIRGDKLGAERAIVILIGKASITIQKGNTKTIIPVVYGFE